MMKNKILFLLLLVCTFADAQEDANIEKKMPTFFSQIDAPFAVDELIKIHRYNPSYLQNLFIKDRNTLPSSYVYLFINDKCANVLYDSLTSKADFNSDIIINEMKQVLPRFTIVKPDVNWGDVFKMCDTCPFLQDSYDDIIFPIKFALLYMEYDEILEMMNYKNGEGWENMLKSMASEDYFTSNICTNDIRYRIKSSEIKFLIDKWGKYNDVQIQELVSVLKNLLKEERTPLESFGGTWNVSISGKKYMLTLEIKSDSKIRATLLDVEEQKEIFLEGFYEDFGCKICLKMMSSEFNDIFDLTLYKSNRTIKGFWNENLTGKKKMVKSIFK